MQIEHYNAIAKIVGGVLDNNERLNAMVKTLTNYFESVDEDFNSGEFRSACLNGHFMEETSETDVEPIKEAVMPVHSDNRAYNWKPTIQSSVREDNSEYEEATARMSKIVAKNFIKKEK